MEQLRKYKNTLKLPNDLVKISDLLEFEGPILSHFTDSAGKNYLFYWVDYDVEVNRWLVWEVTTKQIAEYLKGLVSLKNLLEKNNKTALFIVDIDAECHYKNVVTLELNHIPTPYVPEDTSFYTFDIPERYKTIVEAHKTGVKTYADIVSSLSTSYAFNEPATPSLASKRDT